MFCEQTNRCWGNDERRYVDCLFVHLGMSEPMNFQMELSRKFEEQTVMVNSSDEKHS
jgi:hypothetical protein